MSQGIWDIVPVTKFKNEYERNNKGKKNKGMRCFPDCCIDGHNRNGYCGRPIIVELSHLGIFQPAAYSIFCRCRLHTKEGDIDPFSQPKTKEQLLDDPDIVEGKFELNSDSGRKSFVAVFTRTKAIIYNWYAFTNINNMNTSCNHLLLSRKACRWDSDANHVVEFTLCVNRGGLLHKIYQCDAKDRFTISCTKTGKKSENRESSYISYHKTVATLPQKRKSNIKQTPQSLCDDESHSHADLLEPDFDFLSPMSCKSRRTCMSGSPFRCSSVLTLPTGSDFDKYLADYSVFSLNFSPAGPSRADRVISSTPPIYKNPFRIPEFSIHDKVFPGLLQGISSNTVKKRSLTLYSSPSSPIAPNKNIIFPQKKV